MKVWDAVVLGGGPAGLAAGLQLARAGRRTLLVERDGLGGQARFLGRIENYPGFPGGVSGRALMERWRRQAVRWGLETLAADASALRGAPGRWRLSLAGGREVAARAVVLCPGGVFRRLRVPGESRLFGKGLAHAAFGAARAQAGRAVAVVGGGEAAVHQAVELARWARRVHLVARGPLAAHGLLLRRLGSRRNVELLRGVVTRVEGRARVEALRVREAGRRGRRLPVVAVFVLAGKTRSPWTAHAGRPGVFAAGDALGHRDRQVAVAGGDGLRAAMRCLRWLAERGP